MDFYLSFKLLHVARLWITLAPAIAAAAFPRWPLMGASRQTAGA
jgi:hypothetical protein